MGDGWSTEIEVKHGETSATDLAGLPRWELVLRPANIRLRGIIHNEY